MVKLVNYQCLKRGASACGGSFTRKYLIPVFLLVVVWPALPLGALAAAKTISLAQLIVTPEEYHEKEVAFMGVFQQVEGFGAVFFSKEHAEHRVLSNAVKVEIPPSMKGSPVKQLNGKYVIVRGTFHFRDGGSPGVVKNIGLFEESKVDFR